jgi:hypothetical protein
MVMDERGTIGLVLGKEQCKAWNCERNPQSGINGQYLKMNGQLMGTENVHVTDKNKYKPA